MNTSPTWHTVISADTLKMGQRIVTKINHLSLAVFHLDDGFYAIEDNCPHQHMPLCSGMVEDNEIECPFHGARFNIKTGEVTAPPAFEGLLCFEVRVEQGQVQVLI